jgi:hypothetical protein
MRKIRLCNRDVHLEQGHFWADAGDEFFIVARSLADVIVTAQQAEAAYLAGTWPSWENQDSKVTVIAGLATSLPEDAVPDFTSPGGDPVIHRTEDASSGAPVFWIQRGDDVRAFITVIHAQQWRSDAEKFGVKQADEEHLLSLKIDGY